MYNRISSIQAIKRNVEMAKYQSQSTDIYEKTLEELKNDPKYSGWPESTLEDMANSIVRKSNMSTLKLDSDRVLYNFGKPTDPLWSQFTYQEILEMEANGEVVPEDFLEWAHSMEGADTSEYELDETDSLNENGADVAKADAGDSTRVGEKRAAKVLSQKAILQQEVLENAQKEFEQYSAQVDISIAESESLQVQSLQKVQSMMNEWQALDAKAKSGEKLTSEEQAKYGQLGIMMNNEVNASNVQISNFTTDFDEIATMMKATSKEAKLAQDFATEATHLGRLIAPNEGKHDYRMVHGNTGFGGSFGVIDDLKTAAVDRNVAINTIKQGNQLQSTVSTSDKAIKRISNQMKDMTNTVDVGNAAILTEVTNAQTQSSTVEKKEDVGEVPKVAPPPPKEGMDAPPPPPVEKESAEGEENVFTKEEDLNDINSIVKRQQKKAPEPEIDNMIIN